MTPYQWLLPPSPLRTEWRLFLEERIRCGLRGTFSRHFRFEAGNFFAKQADALGKLADRKQRQILSQLVGHFLFRQIVGVDSGHFGVLREQALSAAAAVVTSAARL